MKGPLKWVSDSEVDSFPEEIRTVWHKHGKVPGAILKGDTQVYYELTRMGLNLNNLQISFRPRIELMVSMPGKRKVGDGAGLTNSFGIAFP